MYSADRAPYASLTLETVMMIILGSRRLLNSLGLFPFQFRGTVLTSESIGRERARPQTSSSMKPRTVSTTRRATADASSADDFSTAIE